MVTQQEHVHDSSPNHKHGPHSQAAAQMREAALKFLETLSAEQKTRAAFRYMDGERIFWYYPPMNRHGLMLLDMEPGQREAAFALMASGLSQRANEQAKLIIDHELVLGPLEIEQKVVTYERNPLRYSWTIFGDPAGTEPWGWRVEGHHVSLHYSIWGDDVVSVTPFFFGSNPVEVRKGPNPGFPSAPSPRPGDGADGKPGFGPALQGDDLRRGPAGYSDLQCLSCLPSQGAGSARLPNVRHSIRRC